MNLSIDGHTLLVPGLSNHLGQSRLLARKAHSQVDCRNKPIGPMSPRRHATHFNGSAGCVTTSYEALSSSSAGSWGLRRHRARAWTRSDQTRCGTRLVSASVFPWQEPHAGAGDGNDVSQWRCRMLPTIWGYSGSFPPVASWKRSNVTASAWAQASTPVTNLPSHDLYGEMLSGGANRPAFGEFLRRF
jgi:hypothetical protein